MDKNKICEAMYALPGDVVVRHRKPLLVPIVLFIAGAALIASNNLLGGMISNDLGSSAVFVGGLVAVVGLIMALARLFGSDGVPFHKPGKHYLVYEELYFDRNIRDAVMESIRGGAVDQLLQLKRAQVPALTVAMYRTRDNRFAAMQAYEYTDLEYRPLSELKIVQ